MTAAARIRAAAVVASAALCTALTLLFCFLPAAAWAGEGGLDPAFGEGGLVTTPLDTARRSEVELGVGPDGSAVVGDLFGYLVRFAPDGSPEPAFGEGGRLVLGRDPISEAVAERRFSPRNFAVDGVGHLLVFGAESDSRRVFRAPPYTSSYTAPELRAVVLRLTPEGEPDSTFGGGTGFFRSSFGLRSRFATDIPLIAGLLGTVDSRERPVFVLGAETFALSHAGGLASYPRAVARLTEAGAVDRSFGGNGVTPITGSTVFPSLGIDASDRPAIRVGPCLRRRLNCRSGTALVRLRADGAPLRRFGHRGARTFGEPLRLAFVEPSGAMILAHRHGRTLQVVRIGLSGRSDNGFGTGGTARVRLPAAFGSHVGPVAADAQGRILLAGFLGRAEPYDVRGPKHPFLALARLLPDGHMDTSFGEGGWIVSPVPEPLEVGATEATLDPQGRLLLAATITAPGEDKGGYLLARYLLGP